MARHGNTTKLVTLLSSGRKMRVTRSSGGRFTLQLLDTQDRNPYKVAELHDVGAARVFIRAYFPNPDSMNQILAAVDYLELKARGD